MNYDSSPVCTPPSIQTPERRPLGDITNRTPTSELRPRRPHVKLPSPALPNALSRQPHSDLPPLQNDACASAIAHNRRVSAIVLEDATFKRHSITSASSTENPRWSGGKIKRKVGPWMLGKTLGSGSSGRVRQAKHMSTGQVSAAKVISRLSAQQMRSFSVQNMDLILGHLPRSDNEKRRLPYGVEREIVIMKVLDHPNLMKVYDVWENRNELYLFLEYVPGGELLTYITETGPLNERESVRLFRQIISGLAFCHRFWLCHRDLKPENILLDELGNVKIADFGMAVMNKQGELLASQCGSPHYAAPELCRLGKVGGYRGDLADIWASGVILYAMLCKMLPFGNDCVAQNDEEIMRIVPQIMSEILRGDYIVPSHVSDEAADLINQILQPDPSERILIHEMWQHPLLTRYEHFAGDPKVADRWIGGLAPDLTVEDCGPRIRRKQELSKEHVRNLSTLTRIHDEKKIIQLLLNDEANFEKVLYRALVRFQTDLEENFPSDVDTSGSDYHHVMGPGIRRSYTRSSLHSTALPRSRSRFSVVNENSRGSSLSTRRASSGATGSSYDPFRRRQPISSDAAYARVTVYGPDEELPSRLSQSAVWKSGGSLRHPAITRIQSAESVNMTSSPPPPSPGYHSVKSSSRSRGIVRVQSRGSITSSQKSWNTSTGSVVIHRVRSRKRPVKFGHVRRHSRSDHDLSRPQAPSPSSALNRHIQEALPSSTPNLRSDAFSDALGFPVIQARKMRGGSSDASSRTKRNSTYWREEARKVSIELSRFCDVAFNSTDGAVARDAAKLQFETPLRSKQLLRKAESNDLRELARSQVIQRYEQRPLPEAPVSESLSFQTQKELLKARENIRRLRDKAADTDPKVLDALLEHFDRLVLSSSARVADEERTHRILSAPNPRSPEPKQTLSPVKEENESPHSIRRFSRFFGPRHSSEPISRGFTAYGTAFQPRGSTDTPTIRLVEHHLRSPKKILEVRNRANTSVDSSRKSQRRSTSGQRRTFDFRDPLRQHGKETALAADQVTTTVAVEGTNDPNIASESGGRHKQPSASPGDGGIRNWFRRNNVKDDCSESGPSPPPKDQSFSNIEDIQQLEEGRMKNEKQSRRVSGSLTQAYEGEKTVKRRFFEWLTRRPIKGDLLADYTYQDVHGDEIDSLTWSESTASRQVLGSQHREDWNSTATTVSRQGAARASADRLPQITDGRNIESQPQNWFTRFLHVKPSVKLFAFGVTKAKAMREIRGVFRAWRTHGMKGVVCDKKAGRIWARVDTENRLHIKPVTIACEFFMIEHQGRKGTLSVARLTQGSGAKSSFKRVVETLRLVLKQRDILMKDRKKAKEMKRCVKLAIST